MASSLPGVVVGAAVESHDAARARRARVADAVSDGRRSRRAARRRCGDAAALTIAAAASAPRHRPRVTRAACCRIALAGGRTPRAVYERLAEVRHAGDRLDARPHRVRRRAPRAARSRGQQLPDGARRAVRSRADARAQVHRIAAERGDAAGAADAYAAVLSRAFALAPGGWPALDVVLLGVGADGHTASLFPQRRSLDGRRCGWRPPAIAPAAPTSRVTLTYPVLNAARAVVVLVSGADKAVAVARAFDDRVPVADCPVRGVRPAAGSLTWHLDAAAASKLAAALGR